MTDAKTGEGAAVEDGKGAKAEAGEAKAEAGEAKAEAGDAKAEAGDAKAEAGDAKAEAGDASGANEGDEAPTAEHGKVTGSSRPNTAARKAHGVGSVVISPIAQLKRESALPDRLFRTLRENQMLAAAAHLDFEVRIFARAQRQCDTWGCTTMEVVSKFGLPAGAPLSITECASIMSALLDHASAGSIDAAVAAVKGAEGGGGESGEPQAVTAPSRDATIAADAAQKIAIDTSSALSPDLLAQVIRTSADERDRRDNSPMKRPLPPQSTQVGTFGTTPTGRCHGEDPIAQAKSEQRRALQRQRSTHLMRRKSEFEANGANWNRAKAAEARKLREEKEAAEREEAKRKEERQKTAAESYKKWSAKKARVIASKKRRQARELAQLSQKLQEIEDARRATDAELSNTRSKASLPSLGSKRRKKAKKYGVGNPYHPDLEYVLAQVALSPYLVGIATPYEKQSLQMAKKLRDIKYHDDSRSHGASSASKPESRQRQSRNQQSPSELGTIGTASLMHTETLDDSALGMSANGSTALGSGSRNPDCDNNALTKVRAISSAPEPDPPAPPAPSSGEVSATGAGVEGGASASSHESSFPANGSTSTEILPGQRSTMDATATTTDSTKGGVSGGRMRRSLGPGTSASRLPPGLVERGWQSYRDVVSFSGGYTNDDHGSSRKNRKRDNQTDKADHASEAGTDGDGSDGGNANGDKKEAGGDGPESSNPETKTDARGKAKDATAKGSSPRKRKKKRVKRSQTSSENGAGRRISTSNSGDRAMSGPAGAARAESQKTGGDATSSPAATSSAETSDKALGQSDAGAFEATAKPGGAATEEEASIPPEEAGEESPKPSEKAGEEAPKPSEETREEASKPSPSETEEEAGAAEVATNATSETKAVEGPRPSADATATSGGATNSRPEVDGEPSAATSEAAQAPPPS